jgi:hypothetical protein
MRAAASQRCIILSDLFTFGWRRSYLLLINGLKGEDRSTRHSRIAPQDPSAAAAKAADWGQSGEPNRVIQGERAPRAYRLQRRIINLGQSDGKNVVLIIHNNPYIVSCAPVTMHAVNSARGGVKGSRYIRWGTRRPTRPGRIGRLVDSDNRDNLTAGNC